MGVNSNKDGGAIVSAARNLYEKMYTYRMYCEMDDDGVRYEIIDGVPYMMAAPSRQHQKVLGEVYLKLGNFLQGKKCEVYLAPFDVRLAIYGEVGDDVINVVQPDVMVFCDSSKLDDKGAIAAPDIAIEILSPSSAKNDRYRKFNLYEKAGVREYWIVDVAHESVEVFVSNNGKFMLSAFFQNDDVVTSTVLEDLEIKVSDVFARPFS